MTDTTRSDPLYHKKLRRQTVPKPRFVKMVDLRGYELVQSERPAVWPVDSCYRIREYLLQTPCFLWQTGSARVVPVVSRTRRLKLR
jgi:hypothetical protein